MRFLKKIKNFFLILLLLNSQNLFSQGERFIHQERSLYTNIIVTENSERRCMRFTIAHHYGQNQSCQYLQEPEKLVFPYAKMVLSSLLIQDNPKKILILGLGGATLVHSYRALFPDVDITIVEIDEAVVRVAKEYFGFAEDSNTHVLAQDGRVYVKRAQLRGEKYDLVILDAFNGEYIPEHLLTQEFLKETASLLSSEGLLVSNTFSTSRLYDAESATYASVFGDFFNVKMNGTGNRIIIVSPSGLPSENFMNERAMTLYPRLRRFGMDLRDFPILMDTNRDWNRNARLLTDQYSPANLLNN
jgi:spermidine synthase